MNVLYRMCPEGNPNKHRPSGMSKMEVVKTCYQSFLQAFDTAEVTFLIDKPNYEILEMVEFCPFPHTIETFHFTDWNLGNVGTFHRQLDLAKDMDKVLLLEDDYFLLPGSGKVIENALETLEFLTPYDHPGYYTEDTHFYKRWVSLAGNHHWQNVISTTLTFATKGKLIAENIDLIKSFEWRDHFMWLELTKNHNLWSPIPTLATHMEQEFLSPAYDFSFNANN